MPTEDVGEGRDIEVQRTLERGHFPFAIPVKTCLTAAEESDRAGIVDVRIGDLALEHQVGHEVERLLRVRFVKDELRAVGREHIAAELFVESVEETPYGRVLHSEGEPNIAGDFLRTQKSIGERFRAL